MTLSALIEQGEVMAQETQKINHAQLAKAYTNSSEPISVARNRSTRKGEPAILAPQNITNDKQSDKQTEYLNDTTFTTATSVPKHVNEPQILAALDRVLLQGGKVRIEIATRREKAANSWRSWSWPIPPDNSTKAMEGIRLCLTEHPQSFIKLIGYVEA